MDLYLEVNPGRKRKLPQARSLPGWGFIITTTAVLVPAPDRRAPPTFNVAREKKPVCSNPNTETVRKYFAEVINDRQLSLLGELFTPDCTFTTPRKVGIGMRVMTSNYLSEWLNAFPDMRADDVQLITADDVVAARVTVKGRQSRTFAGFPATGRHLSLIWYCWFQLREGKICRMDVLFDPQLLFSELGWGEPRPLR